MDAGVPAVNGAVLTELAVAGAPRGESSIWGVRLGVSVRRPLKFTAASLSGWSRNRIPRIELGATIGPARLVRMGRERSAAVGARIS